MRLSKFSTVFFLTVVFSVFHIQAVTWAVMVPMGTPILVVDGVGDGNMTVSPVVSSPIPGFTFGQVLSDGNFSSNVNLLTGGLLINFAIQDSADHNKVYSMVTPGSGIIFTGTLQGTLFTNNDAQVPSEPGDYYNTLSLTWSGVGGPFDISVNTLNGGGNSKDGFAAVPIPPVALLFGTGLIGLIGIARRNLFVK